MIHSTLVRLTLWLIFGSAAYGVYWTATQHRKLTPASASAQIPRQPPSTPGQTRAVRPASVETYPFARWAASASAATLQANATSISDPERRIVVLDGMLNARIQNMPLRSLLSDIQTQSAIPIHSSEELDALLISGELDRAPLPEGLLQLLPGLDVFFFFGAAERSVPTLKAVWVYPKHKGETLAPLPFAAHASSPALQRSAPHGMAADSVAHAGLDARDPASVMIELGHALESPDPKLRYRALATSLEKQIDLPAYALQQTVLSDADREVRGLALTALTQNRAADEFVVRGTAHAALNDSDPEIQLLAKGILEYLDLAAMPDEGAQVPHQ